LILIEVGKIFAERRKELGLRKFTVAKRAGVVGAYIGAIEDGKKSPSLKVVSKIADVLGLEVKIEKKPNS